MNQTSLARSARPTHLSEETSEHIADESHRYDEDLHDVHAAVVREHAEAATASSRACCDRSSLGVPSAWGNCVRTMARLHLYWAPDSLVLS